MGELDSDPAPLDAPAESSLTIHQSRIPADDSGRWGIGDNEANWLGCFFDDYIDVDPQEVWPGWPDGWEPADTVPKKHQR